MSEWLEDERQNHPRSSGVVFQLCLSLASFFAEERILNKAGYISLDRVLFHCVD